MAVIQKIEIGKDGSYVLIQSASGRSWKLTADGLRAFYSAQKDANEADKLESCTTAVKADAEKTLQPTSLRVDEFDIVFDPKTGEAQSVSVFSAPAPAEKEIG